MIAAQPTHSSVPITDDDFERFRDMFYRKTGIMFGASKRYFVDKRLQSRIADCALPTFRSYFDLVRSPGGTAELQKLVNAMTVNETYFYREEYQLQCMVRSLLPEIARRKRPGDAIRIWSMPCSTGEEPYSIAFYLLEHWPDVDDYELAIVASDIDTDVLKKAKAGVYAERAIQHVPKSTAAAYLRPVSGCFQVIDDLRQSITFTQTSILAAADDLAHRNYDLVFCRNLLIYFDDMSRREAAEAIFAALRPGGFVCLGHSESMSRISPLFELRKFPDAIVYQKPV